MFIQTAYFIRVERRQIKVDYEIDSLPLGVSYKERKREKQTETKGKRKRERGIEKGRTRCGTARAAASYEGERVG